MTDLQLLLQTKDHIQLLGLAEVRNIRTMTRYDIQKLQQKARIGWFTNISTQEAICVSTYLYLNVNQLNSAAELVFGRCQEPSHNEFPKRPLLFLHQATKVSYLINPGLHYLQDERSQPRVHQQIHDDRGLVLNIQATGCLC